MIFLIILGHFIHRFQGSDKADKLTAIMHSNLVELGTNIFEFSIFGEFLIREKKNNIINLNQNRIQAEKYSSN